MRPRRDTISKASLRMIGIPSQFHRVSLNDFEVGESSSLAKVKDFVEDYLIHIVDEYEDGNGIFFYGSNGVGKTTLSCIIVKEAFANRYSARRMTFSRYIAEYTEAWGAHNLEDKNELRDRLYHYAKAVDFLVLEEIGKEIDTKIAIPILEDLLRYREDNGLVTIICTNLAPKIVEEKYGASIMSLIQGHMTPIRIVSADKRKE